MKQLSFLVNKSNGVEVLFVDLSHLTGEKCQNWIRANHQMFDEMKSEISEVFFWPNLAEEMQKREDVFWWWHTASMITEWEKSPHSLHARKSLLTKQ